MSVLRDYRKAKGLTQKELGRLCGRSCSIISEIEHDRCYPSVMLAKRLGEVLGFEWVLLFEEVGHDDQRKGT